MTAKLFLQIDNILQLGIFLMRGHGRKITGAPMRELDLAPFWRSLPYAPTGAHTKPGSTGKCRCVGFVRFEVFIDL